MALSPVSVMYGSDPEGFFEKAGRIIGSEKVIPKEGISFLSTYGIRQNPEVVIDGIQFEMHPAPAATTWGLGAGVGSCFRTLRERLRDYPGTSINYKGLVEVTREEIDALSDESQVLGCQPSKNAYRDRPILVDGKTYLKRSAGGHLHFDLTKLPKIFGPEVDERRHLVIVVDTLVGNQAVLLDQQGGMAERRENYGRAGEYRDDKPYGVEYRTLSNFWIRNFALMDFVFGMGNFAISVVNESMGNEDILADLFKDVKNDTIIEAIDTNNFDLAMKNFENLRPFLAKYLPGYGFPLNPNNLDAFKVFAEGIRNLGIQTYFPVDPITHWTEGARMPFSEFLLRLK